MSIKKLGSIVLSAVLIIGLLAGCSTGKEETSSAPSDEVENSATAEEGEATAPEPIVELKAIFPGDAPAEWDTVLAKVNEKLAADNTGVALNIQWVPWADYGNVTLVKTAAKEEFDMFLDAPWLHMDKMIADQAIIALDDLVANAPNLQQSIPSQMWEANKFNGKIMGIPLGTVVGRIEGFGYRKDLAEKYGIGEIKSLADLENYLAAIKKNEPTMVPYIENANQVGLHMIDFNPTVRSNPENYNLVGESYSYFLYFGEDGKVVPAWEKPGFMDVLKNVRNYYKNGYFEKNILLQKDADALFSQGQAAVRRITADGSSDINLFQVEKNVPGAKVDIAYPYDSASPKPVSDFKQWNFLCVTAHSPNAEKVIKLMDWLSIQENHDLLELGVEGTNWNAVGDDQYEVVEGSKYSFPGYVISWRPALVRSGTAYSENAKKWFQYALDGNNFTPSKYIGFNVNPEPVKTELAKLTAAAGEIGPSVMAGLYEPDEALKKLKAAYNQDDLNKVIAEFQAQVDAHLNK